MDIDLDKIYKWLAILAALGAWALSVMFSMDGLAFVMNNEKYQYVGLGIALIITVVELVWSRDGTDNGLTMNVLGLACYAYGIYTNVIGITVAQGNSGNITLFAIAAGLFLEVAPEKLFLRGLLGPNKEGGFFENLFGNAKRASGGVKFTNKNQQDQSHSRPQQQPARPQQQPMSRPPFQMGKPGGGKPAGEPPPSFNEMRRLAEEKVYGGNGSGRPRVEEED